MRQNPHVRICGGPGSATTLVYPTVCDLHVNPGVRIHPFDPNDLSSKKHRSVRIKFCPEGVVAADRCCQRDGQEDANAGDDAQAGE